MIYGFTGTRKGMTDAQARAFADWLNSRATDEDCTAFHHGCCIGADEQASIYIAMVIRPRMPTVIGHPSNMMDMVSHDSIEACDELHPAKPPLDRNRDIVDACDILLATPEGFETLRSGTWSTIRYAKKTGKPCVIFWPNGHVEERKS